MPVIKGNISGSVSTIALNIPCKVSSFFLTNRSIGSVIANVYIATDDLDIAAIPLNTTMISGTRYVVDVPILMEANWYFIVTSNASLDYYFNIEPI